MVKFRYILCLMAFAALSCGCSQKNLDIREFDGEEAILFSPVLEAGTVAKGEMINGTAFGTEREFYASAWNGTTSQFGYTKVKHFQHTSGSMHGYWSTVDGSDKLYEYFWKKSGDSGESKTFYAYSNLPSTAGAATLVNTSSSSQTLSYDVTKAATPETQSDILLGYYSGTGEKKTDYVGRFAKINFRHPLAVVKFKKGEIDGWDSTTDKITEINITNVYASGNCVDNGSFSWTPGSSTTQVTMSGASGLGIDPTTNIIGSPMFIIPQNLATKSFTIGLEITIGGSEYTASCEVSSKNLEAGKYYVFELSYNPSTMVGFIATVTDWGVVYSDDAETIDYFNAVFN